MNTMMRKRNNHSGGGKFNNKGRKYSGGGGSGGGNGGGRNNEANHARTVQRATNAREKYMNMARDALAGGDRIAAENYFQHADHYYRVLRAAQEDMEEFEKYVNRPQTGYDANALADDEAPAGAMPVQSAPAAAHLPAFLKGQTASQNSGDTSHDDEDQREAQGNA